MWKTEVLFYHPPNPKHTHTGPRYVVQIGDKVIDYNEDFRLFLATRNPTPFIPPDAMSVVTEVNFTTTRAGLRGQVTHLKTHTYSRICIYICANQDGASGTGASAIECDSSNIKTTIDMAYCVLVNCHALWPH